MRSLTLLLLLGSLVASAAVSATFTVNSALDIADVNPGDCVCNAGSPSGALCTLRASIQEASNCTLPEPHDVIIPAGLYQLTIGGTGDTTGATGNLHLRGRSGFPLGRIIGAGMGQSIIDGGGLDNVLVADGTPMGSFKISGLTIQNAAGSGLIIDSRNSDTVTDCRIANNTGAGISGGRLTLENSIVESNGGNGVECDRCRISGSLVRANGGSGVVASTNIRLTDSIVADNQGVGGAQGGDPTQGIFALRSTIRGNRGGGLRANNITVEDSTIVGNTTPNDGAGLAGGHLSILNSTIARNVANGHGGGLFMFNGSASDIRSSTIVDNVADADGDGTGDGGGIASGDAPEGRTLGNSIVSGNRDNGGEAPDISATITSLGYNLIGTSAGGVFVGDLTGNLIGVDPLLDLLADNGGPTETHALMEESPAINAGNPTECPLTDQRGLARIDRCDIGAFEVGAVATTTTTTTTSTTTTTAVYSLVPIATRALELRDRSTPPEPNRRRVDLRFSTRGAAAANRIVVPAPGAPGDPTIYTTTLHVFNAAGQTNDFAVVALMASQWRLRGTLTKPEYRYRSSTGSIRAVTLRADRLVIRGGGSEWDYTLNEPSQGSVAVRFFLGDGGWCAIVPPSAASRSDTVDRYEGQPNAPAPAVCPVT